MYHLLLISHLQLISHVQIISHVINSVLKRITTETDDLGVIMEPEAEEGGCEEEFAMQEAEGPEESCEDTPSGTSISVHVTLQDDTIPVVSRNG